MIPWGKWRPDIKGIDSGDLQDVSNALPTINGWKPMQSLSAASDPLPNSDIVRGAGFLLTNAGGGRGFAGSPTKLYEIQLDRSWLDVARLAGGDYNTPLSKKWLFDIFGDTGLSVNGNDELQWINLDAGTEWNDIANAPGFQGTAPFASHIAVVGDFVILANMKLGVAGALQSNLVAWSGLGDAANWNPGINSAGNKLLSAGGPIRGLVGGEVAHIFQRRKITRMIFTATSDIWQFDDIEDRGLLAPYSLTKVGGDIFFLHEDGFYQLNEAGAKSAPIGAKKIDKFFFDNVRPDLVEFTIGAADPTRKLIYFAYMSRFNTTGLPDRMLIYDWTIKEWGKSDLSVSDFVSFIATGLGLDQLDPLGTVDSLQFSFDSSIWAGGSASLGAFSDDNVLGSFTGSNLSAMFETGDNQVNGFQRSHIAGVAPKIQSSNVTVEVATKERLGDSIVYGAPELVEVNGFAPAHASGRFIRTRSKVAAGETWNLGEGVELKLQESGQQ